MEVQMDALNLMDFAIEIGKEELRALQNGEVEEAEAHFARRSELMDLAMRQKDAVDVAQMRRRLIVMQDLQAQLTAEGEEQRNLLRTAINRNKQEGRRHKAYGLSVRQAL